MKNARKQEPGPPGKTNGAVTRRMRPGWSQIGKTPGSAAYPDSGLM